MQQRAGIDALSVADLATRRMGLCFRSSETEAAYRGWFVTHAIPFARIGMYVSIGGWIAAVAVTAIWLPDGLAVVLPWVVLVVLPLIGLAAVASFLPSWRRAVLPLSALANAVAGLVLVGPFAAGALEQPEATGITIGLLLFAFAVFRLPLVLSLLAASGYVVLDLVLVVSSARGGALDTTGTVLHLSVPTVFLAMAVVAHLMRSRVIRDGYRQEQIIARQRDLIAQERDRADRLLLNILPAPIADRLKSGTGVIADAHAAVTVVFADLVGFTRISSQMPAAELVACLDDLFGRFDDLADTLGVEKIRTIGDGYLAVGGLPEPRPDHADAVLDLAARMIAATAECRDAHGVDWHLRVGVHSGPAVAGVIGRRKFAYDLWGDTVNVASRLESTGEPGRIHASLAALAALTRPVPHVARGGVDLRNYGVVETAFVDPADLRRPAGA